jgi:hypothetical protein
MGRGIEGCRGISGYRIEGVRGTTRPLALPFVLA